MRRENRVTALVMTILILLTSIACVVSIDTSAPTTPTAIPATDTPTSIPPTRTPTATVNAYATRWASLEEAVRVELVNMELPSDQGELIWAQNDPVSLSISGPEGVYTEFAESLVAGNFVVYTEFTWDTNSWPTCGVIFRAESSYSRGDFYLVQFLRLSGLPAFDIEYFRDGNYTTILSQEIRFSDYLDINTGARNAIALAAIGNEFTVFVNGHSEGRYYDYSNYLHEGRFAFLASQPNGETTCTFEDTWVWLYP